MAARGPERDERGMADERLRELPRWADRHARNRTMPALLLVGMFFIGFMIFAALGVAIASAFEAGWTSLGVALAVVTGAAAILWIWAAFGGAMGRFVERTSERCCELEGVAVSRVGRRPEFTWRSWIIFPVMVVAPIIFALVPVDPQYSQPLAALVLIPLLVWWVATDGRISWPMGLLWPALYAVHAVAMLLGAPLVIGGDGGMTVLWPLLGYMFVALVAAQIYSRYALRRMREISRVGSDEEAG